MSTLEEGNEDLRIGERSLPFTLSPRVLKTDEPDFFAASEIKKCDINVCLVLLSLVRCVNL